jgi:putative 4-mercaptohistidine N1-methyltranferase
VKRSGPNLYESERYLHEYLLFHYGDPADLCPFQFVPRNWRQFHQRLRKDCLGRPAAPGRIRALDLGCGVGRFSFELGLLADEVVGIDFSQSFIEAAQHMAGKHQISVRVAESGGVFRKRKLSLRENLRKSNVRFEVGDAMNAGHWTSEPFQMVAAVNLLCRLPAPREFLSNLAALVAPGGQLLLASPYSWLEQYTPRKEWLSSKEVERILRQDFNLVGRRDLPFVIREHRRKYQLVISEATTFGRKR